jgi:hypothetical protein
MDPLNDKELDELLRKWEAPAAPRSLKSPLEQRRWPLWPRSFRYSNWIPVPAVALVAALLAYLAVSNLPGTRPGAGERKTEPAPISDETRPELPEVRPQPQPQPQPPLPVVDSPAAAPKTERSAAAPVAPRIEQPLSLAGFQTVPVLEPRIVRERQ